MRRTAAPRRRIGAPDQPSKGPPMVKLIVLYGPPEDPAAFEAYYLNTHVPLAAKIPRVQGFEASRVVPTPDGNAPPYYRIAQVSFASMEDLQAAIASEEGRATTADIPKFATGGANMLVAEVD
jgi:uncharacterized protein (TIGR02118 family)